MFFLAGLPAEGCPPPRRLSSVASEHQFTELPWSPGLCSDLGIQPQGMFPSCPVTMDTAHLDVAYSREKKNCFECNFVFVCVFVCAFRSTRSHAILCSCAQTLKVVSVILGRNINYYINLISPPDPLAVRPVSRTSKQHVSVGQPVLRDHTQ